MTLPEIKEILNAVIKRDWIDYVVLVCTVVTAGTILFYIFNYVIQKRKYRAENAINIAKEYANRIINLNRYIDEVYKAYDVLPVINRLDSMKLMNFDENEMEELHLTEELAVLDAIYKEPLKREEQLLLLCSRGFIPDNPGMVEAVSKEIREKTPQGKEIEKALLPVLKKDFECIVATMLNTLETIGMRFNTNIANDKIVYQSLHQVYLKSVKMLYYPIARINKSAANRNYTNIVDLYKDWNNKYIRKCEKENRLVGKILQRASKAI